VTTLDKPNKVTRRRISWWITTAVSAVLVVAIARRADWHAVGVALASARVTPLVIATVVNLASLGAKGVSWWIFLRALQATSLPLALRATVLGAAINNVVPAHLGEATRVMYVARLSGVSSASVLSALALERTVEGVGLGVLLLLAIAEFGIPPNATLWRAAALILVPAGIAAVIIVWRARAARGDSAPSSAPVPHWRAYLARFGSALGTAASGQRLLVALALVLAAWAMQLATYFLTAAALGLETTPMQTLALLLAANVGSLVRATPGSIGVFQVAYVVTAVALGLPRDVATATALVLQALQIIPVLLLGAALAPIDLWRVVSRRDEEKPEAT
jgi:uncharacterized protein (TIRG00374 family)